ncbi:PREDICTED: uncharacterized protein LOC109581234 [Amphimedon queenslandica]|uniref:Uncharacterized protein n=1 Tax=Amphimedon queenslandica TaxID=400682 RepID=A0A1X7V4H3_AMPQE|nr:PREDICTED: uncharacterized protein LOC109581234 [Amphimedon queenslandica]|eukprot:XP_019850736.1 PREDICTED: uncharacterized protein LOC109581234 [Amphimedon queenslandica]
MSDVMDSQVMSDVMDSREMPATSIMGSEVMPDDIHVDPKIIKALIGLVVDLWNSISEQKIVKKLTEAACKEANDYLEKKYGGWREIVRDTVRQGIDKAAEILQNAKESILEFIQENKEFLKILTQGAAKGGARLIAQCVTKEIARKGTTAVTAVAKSAVTQGGKQFASRATKQVVIQGLKQGIKSATTATGIGLAADVAQAGLEYHGYEKEGKVVGATGNVASGALLGGVVAGPPGIAIGALGGFLIWGGGEVVGKVIDKTF